LAQMAEDVAALVLRDNYLQGEALSVAEARGTVEFRGALDRYIRLIRDLERAGRLDRALEFLPDDEALATRAAARRGLTRPELAVLLAYAKMSLDEELLASDLPDLPELAGDLRHYFPPALLERFAKQIAAHPLHREITATVVTNDLVNRAGITFIHDMRARTAKSPAEIARAYRIVREVFELPSAWANIEALDNRVAARLQSEMLLDIAGLVEHATAWLLRHDRLDLGHDIERLRPSIRELAGLLPTLLPATDRAVIDERARRLVADNVPQRLATAIGGTPFLAAGLEITDLTERTLQPLERAARTYYASGAHFALGEMRAAARRLPAETAWQRQAVDTVIDDLFALQSETALGALQASPEAPDPLPAWAKQRASALAAAEAIAAELRAGAVPDLAMLVVACRQLRQALA
jgi:glutamate dehydrogenase